MSNGKCQDFVDRKFHNIFHFEYGLLDDNTFRISSASNNLLRIDKFTLNALFDLNTGKSMREVAKKYNVELNEIVDIYNRLEPGGFVVTGNCGKIKRSNPIEDIDIFPYILIFLAMAIGQLFYFIYIAKTTLMNRTVEGIIVAAIALAAIFFHEFGHYLFCWKYTMIKPKMRFAILKIFPVVYVDTNLAWRLPRNKRLVVSLSGILFDLAVNTVVVMLVLTKRSLEYFVTPFLLTQYIRISILINPVFKGDGYWILSDLLRTVNMEKRGLEELKKGKISFFSLYGLISLVFSVLAAVGLAWFIFNLARPLAAKFALPFFK